MRRSIFADADRVMRENVDVRQPRECAQSNRRAAIIGENGKRGARGAKKSVIRNTVENRAHAVLANAEANVAALWIVARKVLAILDVVQCRSVQVGAATHE